jgi:hypothetical protein
LHTPGNKHGFGVLHIGNGTSPHLQQLRLLRAAPLHVLAKPQPSLPRRPLHHPPLLNQHPRSPLHLLPTCQPFRHRLPPAPLPHFLLHLPQPSHLLRKYGSRTGTDSDRQQSVSGPRSPRKLPSSPPPWTTLDFEDDHSRTTGWRKVKEAADCLLALTQQQQCQCLKRKDVCGLATPRRNSWPLSHLQLLSNVFPSNPLPSLSGASSTPPPQRRRRPR